MNDKTLSLDEFLEFGAHVCPDGSTRVGRSDGCRACQAWHRRYERRLRWRRRRLTIEIFFLHLLKRTEK